MANTTSGGSTALGLATRPESGVAPDLVVKMEPPAAVTGNAVWNQPRGGETLAHELGHNYTLRHIDQTMSPLACGGGRPLRAGGYPLDACTIGILNSANLVAELGDRTTQFGFDPATWSVINPTNAADLMSYRSSTWISKPSLDTLFDRIPGASGPAQRALAGKVGQALPAMVVLVHGTLDLRLSTAVLRPCFRLPSALFDPEKLTTSLDAAPAGHDWRLRWADAAGAALAEFPLVWGHSDDGDGVKVSFAQFLPDQPGAARLQVMKAGVVLSELQPSQGAPTLTLREPSHDETAHLLSATWLGFDPDQDPLVYTLQFSADDGASWETLQVNYPDLSFATDTRLLRGGSRCRLRVIATDGFHAASAETSSFALPLHAPEMVLGGLHDGERLPFGTASTVTAVAYDAEDGSLEPSTIQWLLEGTETRVGTGATFSLHDLNPGSYSLQVIGTDSDQTSTRISVGFEIEALPIVTAEIPLLDGDCGDAAYAGAPLIRIALAGGGFVHGRMIHANGALHACVSDLLYSGSATTPATVGLRVDRRSSPEVPPQPADLPGFFVDENGIPSERVGDAEVTPEVGFIAVVSRGDGTWSAEWQISDALLGGWNRASQLLLVHANPADPAQRRTWPAGGEESQPRSWAPSALGSAPERQNRPPVAAARGPATLPAATGDRVYLEGTGSFDPDGDAITFEWTQIAGPAVNLESASSAAPSFVVAIGDRGLEWEFQLVVRDAALASAPVSVRVTVVPIAKTPEPLPAGPSTEPVVTTEGLEFVLLWPGSPGDRCLIQASVNLLDWEDLGVRTADYLGRLRFLGEAANRYDHRFYRAIEAPALVPQDPRGAVRFDGLDDVVEVAHRPELNAYPLTLAAWVRTSRNGAFVDGILSKYVDGSFNGYGMFVYFGHLRGFYFGPPGSSVWGGGQGLDGGLIADGEWHHVAMVVDAAGGRLFVDGVQTASLPWVGPPTRPTTTAPLRLGHYHTYPNALLGDLDEVGVWDVAWTAPDLDRLRRTRADAGEVPRPLGLWHFDELEGLSTRDASDQAGPGLLQGGVTWIESEVPAP
ncbi:MAG: LamG domain-containing protein [Verrucomicrobiales bacterium]|nr:LamG domain-containing protein [Verrucomicrobiales bacterium]